MGKPIQLWNIALLLNALQLQQMMWCAFFENKLRETDETERAFWTKNRFSLFCLLKYLKMS